MTQAAATLMSEFETEVTVSRIDHPAEGVALLTLSDPAAGHLPPWTPGAHVDLLLGDDLVRQYSLCSSPAETGSYQVAVLLTPDTRGGSAAVHALAEGGTAHASAAPATTSRW